MKFAKAIVFAALTGSISAHAALTTGENPQGTVNCTAQLQDAQKKVEGLQEVKRVYAENAAAKPPTPQSTGSGKAAH